VTALPWFWNNYCIKLLRKTVVYLPHEITEESREEINGGSLDGIGKQSPGEINGGSLDGIGKQSPGEINGGSHDGIGEQCPGEIIVACHGINNPPAAVTDRAEWPWC